MYTGWLPEIQKNRLSQQHISPIYVAMVSIGLGEGGRAFEWFGEVYEEVYNERSTWLLYIHRNSKHDSLHSDSRDMGLLKK
ncbi:MAG: hypothetical protein AMJ73_00050 [candidate division Zixibacteria bacterium SM1_73]|nr:MAG: hypothetical protein AMJ73_00050 [candidate division Zixibacteria bacterium SM1_73]